MPPVLALMATDGSKCHKRQIHRGLLGVVARIYARHQSFQNSGNDKIHAVFELVLTACEKELPNVSIVSGVRVMLP